MTVWASTWRSQESRRRPDQARLADGTRRRKRLRDETRQQQNGAPHDDEPESRRHEALLGDRNRRLEIAVSGVHDVHIAVPHHQGDATEGPGIEHFLPVGFQVAKPIDVPLHGRALAPRKLVRISPQTRDRALRRLPLRAGIGLETPDDLLQLIDAAAEALAILLGEFRPLRGDDARREDRSRRHKCG